MRCKNTFNKFAFKNDGEGKVLRDEETYPYEGDRRKDEAKVNNHSHDPLVEIADALLNAIDRVTLTIPNKGVGKLLHVKKDRRLIV